MYAHAYPIVSISVFAPNPVRRCTIMTNILCSANTSSRRQSCIQWEWQPGGRPGLLVANGLSLGDARSNVTSMLPLSARLVAYPRTRSFNLHSGVRHDTPAHSLSNIEKLLLSRPSARLYFWGPQGTKDRKRPIKHCRSSPSPKGVLSADKSSLTGRFCQTLNHGP